MPFASTILMVRPAAFGFNKETSSSNPFQHTASYENLQHKVLEEFDGMTAALQSAGIEVFIIEDTPDPIKPDAIFPNNWFCTLPDGSVNIFPMFAKNRRIERRSDLVEQLKQSFDITGMFDWTKDEKNNVFLESTGSMVMDHDNRVIYASVSGRTNPQLLQQFAAAAGYKACSFVAKDKNGLAIYHTNVLMCIGNWFSIACDEAIIPSDQHLFLDAMKQTGKQLISISYHQMLQFAGNMLQLQNKNGDPILVMSTTAFHALKENQKLQLQQFTTLLPVHIPTIETVGGGSARCMMAEIFLKKRRVIPQ